MLVVHDVRAVPPAARGAVLAIGNFDGVHKGHQALLAKACRLAGDSGSPHGVILFEPHPRRFFQPQVPLFELTPLDVKLDLLRRYGAKLAVVLPFDARLAALDADAFITRVLVDGLGLRHLVAGYDFHFGKGRQGSPETLRRASAAGHFGLTVVEPVTAVVAGATPVASSSAVRQALAAGDVGGAAAMLGHWWRVVGPVTGGFKRGTGMGYPTANVRLPAGCGLAHGIYAARVYVGDTRHAGAAYLGTRPTFDNGQAVLETFLLDFDDSLYGKTIAVEFIEHLREDRAFPDAAALIEQIDRDVRATRDILATFASDDPLAWPAEAPVTY